MADDKLDVVAVRLLGRRDRVTVCKRPREDIVEPEEEFQKRI